MRLSRPLRYPPLLVAAVLAACSADSTSNVHGIPALDGLANFIVDSSMLATSWTIGTDVVEAGSCTSIEYDDSDGLFEYAPCHNHFHYKHYVTYELLPILAGGALGTPIMARKRGFCLDDSEPFLPGVNPPYLPDSTDACPVRDEQSFCRVLRESNYADNVATLRITLPAP